MHLSCCFALAVGKQRARFILSWLNQIPLASPSFSACQRDLIGDE